MSDKFSTEMSMLYSEKFNVIFDGEYNKLHSLIDRALELYVKYQHWERQRSEIAEFVGSCVSTMIKNYILPSNFEEKFRSMGVLVIMS